MATLITEGKNCTIASICVNFCVLDPAKQIFRTRYTGANYTFFAQSLCIRSTGLNKGFWRSEKKTYSSVLTTGMFII